MSISRNLKTIPGFGSKPIRHLALTYRIRLEGYLKERVRQSVNILGTLKYPVNSFETN